MQLVEQDPPPGRRRKLKNLPPVFFAEPVMPSNSFVGTEEYIAPVSQTTLSPLLQSSLVCKNSFLNDCNISFCEEF